MEVIVLKDWRAIIAPWYESKGDKRNCRIKQEISLSSVVLRYTLVFWLKGCVEWVSEGLIGEEGANGSGRGCLNQIITLKQMNNKIKN